MTTVLLHGIVDLVIKAVNGLIAGLGDVLAAAVSILPDMPELPDPPEALVNVEGWVAWFFPVQTLLDVFVTLVGLWLIWQGVVIALRWAKAVDR